MITESELKNSMEAAFGNNAYTNDMLEELKISNARIGNSMAFFDFEPVYEGYAPQKANADESGILYAIGIKKKSAPEPVEKIKHYSLKSGSIRSNEHFANYREIPFFSEELGDMALHLGITLYKNSRGSYSPEFVISKKFVINDSSTAQDIISEITYFMEAEKSILNNLNEAKKEIKMLYPRNRRKTAE